MWKPFQRLFLCDLSSESFLFLTFSWALAWLYHHHLKLIVSKSKCILFFSLSRHSFWKALIFPSLAGELGRLSGSAFLSSLSHHMYSFHDQICTIPRYYPNLPVYYNHLPVFNPSCIFISTTLIFLKHDFVIRLDHILNTYYMPGFVVGILFITF